MLAAAPHANKAGSSLRLGQVREIEQVAQPIRGWRILPSSEGCGVPVGPILAELDLARRHQSGSAFVLNQEYEEFRRFDLAGVSPDDVNIRWAFIEGLTRC